MKILRPLIAVIIFLAALFIGALAALPYIVSTDAIRLHLAQNISAWTGYSVEIRQPPRISFFPLFRASLSDVTLSKMGDDNAPFMAAERIEVEMSPFDALFGRVAFSKTRLINAHFTLSEPVDDLPQFVNTIASSSGRLGLAIRQARKITAQSADKSSNYQLQTMPFGRMILENGSVGFTTRGSQQREEVTAINASIDWPQTTSAATIKGQAIWHDETVEYNLNTVQPLIFLANGTSQIDAQINSKPLTLSFNGRSNISENLFIEGAFSLTSPSLNHSLQWLGLSGNDSSSADIPTEDALNLETTVSATRSLIKLSDIALNFNNMPAKGAVEVGFGKDRPIITGTLAFQVLDAASFLRTVTTLITKVREEDRANALHADYFGKTYYVPKRIIDTTLLNSADIDIRLSSQNATIGTAQMSSLAATLQVHDGEAIFDIGDAKAFQGSIQANIKLANAASGQDKLNLRFNAANIDSNSFLVSLGLNNPILNGQGNFSVTAETTLHSLPNMLQNASGQINFTLGKGSMQGFDLNDFIAKINSEGFFALQRRDKASLDFTRLDVKASLGDGVATLENAKAEAAQGILSLTGIVPLTDRSLALSGTLTLPRPDQQTGTANDSVQPPLPAENLHFFVGGSWDRPFISSSK